MDVRTTSGVPEGFNRITANTVHQNIAKGQLNKVGLYPRIGNEHVESSREVQGVVSNGNIVGQVFKASKDNITALMLTLESAAGVVVDTFEDYADSAALQAAWAATGALATLETTTVNGGAKAMSLPTTTLADAWTVTAAPADYTDYTGRFAAFFSHSFAVQQVSVFIGDGVNTKSFTIIQEGPGVWCDCEVNEKAMTEDGGGTTDASAITVIGYRVVAKKLGGTVIIDDLLSVPPPGDIEVKLWDMGPSLPESAATSIDSGTQYEKIGAAQAASYVLNLEGGIRLYHIEEFLCGADRAIPTNELLTPNNYYIIELKWVDTDVSVYGPDTSFTINYYNSGYAFTAPDEATAIAAIGEYSDIMFAILSAQEVYITNAGWRYDAQPKGGAEISVFLEDKDMKVSDVVVDREHSPEQIFTADVSLRPMPLGVGGKVEFYFNDDYTDDVSHADYEMQFLYKTPEVHG